jgi:hypothetical protein
MAKRIEGLGEKMKEREKFEKLPNEIKTSVYKFLTANRKIRRLNRLADNLKIEFKKELNKIEDLKKVQLKIENENFKNIKNLPHNYFTISQLYVNKEKNKKSYIVDMIWCGERRKFSLGTNLKEIQNICRKYNKELRTEISDRNYKNIIIESIKYPLNEFLLKNGTKKYTEQSIQFDKSKMKFKYEKGTAYVDITKSSNKRTKLKEGMNATTPTKMKKANYNDSKNKRWPIPNLNINPN